MEKIGHKMLAFILALCLIVPTSSVFAIDGEGMEEVEQPQIEEIKEEAPAEEPKEEVKKEIKKEPQEVKEKPKEEPQEVTETTKEEVKEVLKEEPQEKTEEIKEEVLISNNTVSEPHKKDTKIKLMASNTTQESINIVLVFTDIRKTDGTIKEITQSNNIKYGGSWGFLPNKFERTTGLRVGSTSTYENRDYIYNGQWIINNKEIIDATKTFRLYHKEQGDAENTIYLMQDTTLTLKPVWEMIKYPGLEFNYTDNISTGSGSWTNKDSIGYYDRTDSYKHSFTNPEDKSPTLTPDYQFQYWQLDEYYQNEERMSNKEGTQYQSGSSFIYSSKGLPQDTKTVVNVYAYWQPAVKINLYNGTELFDTISSFSSINTVDLEKLADTDTKQFIGWFDENGQIADVYNAPAITKENNSILTINLFAKFKEITPPQPNPESEPIPEPTPTPDPTPEVKPTPEPTPEPTPVSPTEPTKPKKDSTVVKKQTTTTTTTETYTETRVISPLPTPKAAEPTIEESKTPLAKPQGTWALLNLILTIISCLIAIILLFVKKKSKNDEYTDEEEKDIRSMRRFKIFSILFGIISIIVFIFTEDMTMPMAWVDRWTILMALFTGIEIANIFIIRQKTQKE